MTLQIGNFLRRITGWNALASGGRQDAARRLSKGIWAVLDQGLFAVSNFVLNVLLARWLTPADYGAFAVAFALFLLIGALHNAVLTEPMLVFGPGRYKDRLPDYLGALVYGHSGFAVLSGALLLLASISLVLVGSSRLPVVLMALALAGPSILLLWLMRRACYIRLQPSLAASGGALYMVLMMSGTYALYHFKWLSAASALGVMSLSSLVVSLWLVVRLRVKWPSLRGDWLPRKVWDDHLAYGRWSVRTQALIWVPQNSYYLLLPMWGGLEAGASLKALMNLIMPITHANTSLSTLLLPALVRNRGSAKFGALLRFALAFFVLGSVLYWVFLGVFHDELITWLYGGRYGASADLLWFLGLLPISGGVIAAFAASLRAYERPDQIFRATAASAGATLTLGLAAMFVWGVNGAVISLLASSLVGAVAMSYLFGAFRTDAGKEGHKIE